MVSWAQLGDSMVKGQPMGVRFFFVNTKRGFSHAPVLLPSHSILSSLRSVLTPKLDHVGKLFFFTNALQFTVQNIDQVI